MTKFRVLIMGNVAQGHQKLSTEETDFAMVCVFGRVNIDEPELVIHLIGYEL